MVKPPYCDKIKMQTKEVHLTEEEDTKAHAYAPKQGTGNWAAAMPKKSGARRCGKSCRIRWSGNQRPDPEQGSFTPEEEDLIIKLHAAIGSRWPIIAQQLPGRTDNDVKNVWNTKLKKKLSAIGIDPVTHRPFSQILADYGNIGGFPKARNRSGCLSRDIKNAFVLKSEQSRGLPERSSHFDSHFGTTISPLAVEPSKQHFMSNCNHISAARSQSLELLSQLQAITMVTEASTYTNTAAQIPAECYSSSASSSPESPPSATNQAAASPSFSWCDFLLEDAFVPTTYIEEKENEMKLPPSYDPKSKEMKLSVAAAEEEVDISAKTVEASSISCGSFVEAMLEGENGMLSDFHGLLEDPFFY
ncbi:unnamed protein product [Coffea canephora]|uniref:Uncharacterized protein n=1 Tax=Coffea canephora TaxID=49390 RepID=A0A068V4V0_COFCA|nr:unnamed protein product [Coffea canephora]